MRCSLDGLIVSSGKGDKGKGMSGGYRPHTPSVMHPPPPKSAPAAVLVGLFSDNRKIC